jgi:hypothetical protein
MSGMREYSATGRPPRPDDMQPVNVGSAWEGWVVFAGWMLILLGCFHVIEGLAAVFRDEVFLVGQSGLVVNVDYTVWGWVHVVGGVVAILAGIALNRGQMWARIVAVVVAFLSALVNIAFLPAYPIWSGILITLDVLIIWAVTVHGSELKDVAPPAHR